MDGSVVEVLRARGVGGGGAGGLEGSELAEEGECVESASVGRVGALEEGLGAQEAAECRRWRPLSAAGKGEEWLWVRTSGVMVVRFSLVRATMTRSSEEMRAWRGGGGEEPRRSLVRATVKPMRTAVGGRVASTRGR